MQDWVDKLQVDYQDYVIHDDRSKGYMCIGVIIPYMKIAEFFKVFIWNYHNREAISVGIELTKDGKPLRKEIEPKVEELVRKKKGFLKGKEWLYYKFVSYEEAYPLLQELVRELQFI